MAHVLPPHNLALGMISSRRYGVINKNRGLLSRTTHYSAIITTLISYTFADYISYLFTRAVTRLRFCGQHGEKALVTPGQASSGLVRRQLLWLKLGAGHHTIP